MKSTSSHPPLRGTRTTKKMTSTAAAAAVDSYDHHPDIDNDDDDDDLPNDDDIIINNNNNASLPTAFETVLRASSRRRRGRATPRGTFGGGGGTRAARHPPSTNKTVLLSQDSRPPHFEAENVTQHRRLNSIASVGAADSMDDDDDDDDDATNLLDLLNPSSVSRSTGTTSIPSDLRPPHLNPHRNHHHHQRSESALPVLTTVDKRRSPFRLIRGGSSSSTTNDVVVPPRLLTRSRRLQRSHSVAVNHHHHHHHHHAVNNEEETNLDDLWGEHHPDHGLDAIERTVQPPPRNARTLFHRRHSWIPYSNPPLTRSTSTTTTGTANSSGSFSSLPHHGSVSSFPNAIDELDVAASSTLHMSQPKISSSTSLSHFPDNNDATNNMSPDPPRSETSTSTTGGCRKRGVSTSSISDLENDYLQLSGGSLSSYKRRQHYAVSSLSLSEPYLTRVFAVPPGQVLPPVPSLHTNLEHDHHHYDRTKEDWGDLDLVTHSTLTTSHPRMARDGPAIGHRETARGLEQPAMEAMDQDTSMEDNDDETLEHEASPDSSLVGEHDDEDDGTTGRLPQGHIPSTANVWVVDENDLDTKMERVLETMPSIDDLTFLINELKNEERRNRNVMVGAGDMWKIAPPLQQWTSHRRTTFIHWATTSLGFIVRSAGMGYMFVIIHKKRGLQLMDLLEQAYLRYQTTTKTNPAPGTTTLHTTPHVALPLFVTHPVVPRPSLTPPARGGGPDHDAHSKLRRGSGPLMHKRRTNQNHHHHSILDTTELTDKLSSLSMTSNSNQVATNHSQTRTVTLPTISDENISLSNLDSEKCDRLSIEPMGVESKSSRPSFDCHTHSGELSLHLLGHSPRMNAGRPPKGTYRYSTDGADQGGNTRSGRTPNTDNLCFVTTPLMVKDRGWGSRPIDGRDWGTSLSCENAMLHELTIRFERCLEMNGVMSTSGEYQVPLISLSQQDFDLEAENEKLSDHTADVDADIILDQKNADRLHKKRISNYNMRKRMSLFASAVNSQVNVPIRRLKCIEAIDELDENVGAAELSGQNERVITTILSFLNESELMTKAFPVCKAWSDYATMTHTELLMTSIQCDSVENVSGSSRAQNQTPILEISWKAMHRRFPWGCFLAEGGAKKVHKVYNSSVNAEEALSVMDTHSIDNAQIVANELAISAMASSLVRRGVSPNFVAMHRVFTCAYPPPASHWGSDINKYPKGANYDKNKGSGTPREPKCSNPGRYQYIQMELATEGDAEELIKRQLNGLFPTDVARNLLFQISFALFAASEKFSIKHYDIKLLNVFVQKTNPEGDLVLRYGLGSHVFAVKMPRKAAYIAKLADFGTSNMSPSTNGLPVTIAHFTTLENTPPDYFILGDFAKQGHAHDHFGLGLVMLHLFTGFRPYEEILEDVICPPNLKERLQKIWENERVSGYSVIRSVIFDGVDVDECGNVIGEPDNTLYDTLYRFLVLFGIPKQKFQEKHGRLVWNAITDTLQGTSGNTKRASKNSGRKKSNTDMTTFKRDCKKYSIRTGTNTYIARARSALTVMDGGLDLLFCLCNFDPSIRATSMDVLNSKFMDSLREQPGWMRHDYNPSADVRSFLSFSTTASGQ